MKRLKEYLFLFIVSATFFNLFCSQKHDLMHRFSDKTVAIEFNLLIGSKLDNKNTNVPLYKQESTEREYIFSNDLYEYIMKILTEKRLFETLKTDLIINNMTGKIMQYGLFYPMEESGSKFFVFRSDS